MNQTSSIAPRQPPRAPTAAIGAARSGPLGVSFLGASARLHPPDLTILGRAGRFQRLEQTACRFRYFIDGAPEGRLVGARGVGESAQLAHELQCRGADLFFCRRRLEVEQRANIAAHRSLLQYA